MIGRVSVVAPSDLTDAQIAAWRRFQAQREELGSPYLTPEYARIVASVRPGVSVAVAEVNSRPVGFFAFERRSGGLGRPVGGPLNDCQAVIADPSWSWNARDLVQAAGLSMFDFTHMRAAPNPFVPYYRSITVSHVIDLRRGFDEYLREQREAAGPTEGSGRPHHAAARLRKLEKQVGPVCFKVHDADPNTLRLLLNWKSQQYRRTGVPDAFARPWCRDLIECFHAHQSPHLSGVLTTLSSGGKIIAIHMGMRAGSTWHWWFPAYDAAYSQYSPGLILLVELCRRAPEMGVRFVELGAGDEAYKPKVANSAFAEASGFVGGASPWTLLRHLRRGTIKVASSLPIGPMAQWPAKAFRRIDQATRYW